jgi:ribonuclease P protein component
VHQTLPKSSILRGYQRFSNVINNGVCFSEQHLSCFVLLTTIETERHNSTIAIGFSVPKRIIPLAVHRNRIKRIMREAVRKDFQTLKTRRQFESMEIVLMYKGRPLHEDNDVSLSSFISEWQKIRQKVEGLK